jgi:hypothetical protein
MVGSPSTDQAYRGEGNAENVRTVQEEMNALHSSDSPSISDETADYDAELMKKAAQAFEQFDTYPVMTDGGEYDGEDSRIEESTNYGVTRERLGNSVDDYSLEEEDDDYSSEEKDFDPHDEGPNYDEWVNGFEDREALRAFSGLFNE